jgi:superfamily II DNA or RNA helicase
MSANNDASDLFIVDNSNGDWKVRSYLREWCELSSAIDIATGYFEIGSLLALEDRWQQVDKIRILMGDEVSLRTKRAFESCLQILLERLEESIESEKKKNDFLEGVPAIVEALVTEKILCRVYRKDKFHAKCYLTHGRSKVVGSFGLVGSSNFTYPGLCDNVELNVRISGPEVGLLQEWYERHWEEAEPVTPDVLRVLERHTKPRSPFEIWFKALHEYLRGHELSPDEWDRRHSIVFSRLAKYQQDAYKNLVAMARRYGCGFLCDGVGLGKTYVGLMLIERMVVHEGKRLVLFAPKSAKEDVWEPIVENFLPHLNSDFQNFVCYAHTDLQRKGKWRDKIQRTLKDADIILIDEAHHFRTPGIAGTGEREPSRYRRLQSYIHQAGGRPKQLFFLTATPVNNSIHDFRHILELVTNKDESYFAKAGQNLGIHSLSRYFVEIEKRMLKGIQTDSDEQLALMEDALKADILFDKLVVQRSRSFVRESLQIQERDKVIFPHREAPRIVPYKLKITYGRLLDSVEKAFNREKPLFALGIYNPMGYALVAPTDEEGSFEANRQKQVVALIRTQFLKRFESSAYAFEQSCWRLLKKLLAWVEVHAESSHDRNRLERWKTRHAELINYTREKQSEFWSENEEDEDSDSDFLTAEDLAAVEKLNAEYFKVDEILDDTFDDLNQIAEFLTLSQDVRPERDSKLSALVKLLTEDKDASDRKILLFTEFADTARYVERELANKGLKGIVRIDGSSTQRQRTSVIQRFAPFYNHQAPPPPEDSIRILIATDVLAEGLNLQDADRLINYDLHWNPVRLMQRIGRVDRRLSPEIEELILKSSGKKSATRGTVVYWNFLPPDELEELLALYGRVNRKTLVISKAFGIEGRKLLRPDDEFDPVKEINEQFEGQQTETEKLMLEYERLVLEHPDLAAALPKLPLKVFSGKKNDGAGPAGVFFCFRIPRPDPDLKAADASMTWTDQAGETLWSFISLDSGEATSDPARIAELIRSAPDTARYCSMDRAKLSQLRAAAEKEAVNKYLRPLQAPIGISPILKCWMEVD